MASEYFTNTVYFLSSAEIGPRDSSTTLYVRSQKVGINTESPNHALTITGNVSATGVYYGDGSQLTGIVAGDTVATNLVRSSSANWNSVYSNVNANSGTWSQPASNVNSLTANWESTYTTVQSNSSTNWDNSVSNLYTHSNFLPLTGGNLIGALTTTSTISSSQTISASGARVITGLPSDPTPVHYITVLTQGEYDAIALPDANTLYLIKP